MTIIVLFKIVRQHAYNFIIFDLDNGTECYNIKSTDFGTWRSLEAHLNGVQGARGSNPRVPTM